MNYKSMKTSGSELYDAKLTLHTFDHFNLRSITFGLGHIALFYAQKSQAFKIVEICVLDSVNFIKRGVNIQISKMEKKSINN